VNKATRTNNLGVVRAWARGERARNGKGTLSTDGTALSSYNLIIGYRTKEGTLIVGDFTAPGGGYFSQTTSCHVSRAKGVADDVFHPEVFNNTFEPEGFSIK
jgi:hypothetical protein